MERKLVKDRLLQLSVILGLIAGVVWMAYQDLTNHGIDWITIAVAVAFFAALTTGFVRTWLEITSSMRTIKRLKKEAGTAQSLN